jgi:site-specific recombinase XerD
MGIRYTDFDRMTKDLSQHMAKNLCYSKKTIYAYAIVWKQVRAIMESKGVIIYDEKIGKSIIHDIVKNRKIQNLNRGEKHFCNAVSFLTEYQLEGNITIPAPPKKDPLVFEGALGKSITQFIEYKINIDRVSKSSVDHYKRSLYKFLKYCNSNNIESLQALSLHSILTYLTCKETKSAYENKVILSAIKVFMAYAYDKKLIAKDIGRSLPRHKIVHQPKLPSTYTIEEIEQLINSINRAGAIGKRNFAIILLACRLGLRASDISRLKFENICWTTSTINLAQVKTGKILNLPLLDDVGNAIIDYLKFGRPVSNEPYIFLTEKPPKVPFPSSNVVTHVVQKALVKAGINIKNRRFGPHSLRHSLGSRLLKINTILPVISEVLGHQNTESTKYYLRIDIESLKHCMLDVPNVSTDFYLQKNGAFYA